MEGCTLTSFASVIYLLNAVMFVGFPLAEIGTASTRPRHGLEHDGEKVLWDVLNTRLKYSL